MAIDEKLYDNFAEEFNTGFFAAHPDLNISLVLGLHPDQATEPLVDACLSTNVPFAVIPCCIFSHENPHRKLKNGQCPNSYETFCQFLQEKHEDIASDFLPFLGRNKVLYKTFLTKA